MNDNYLLEFFTYEHLKPELQAISKPFCELAKHITTTIKPHPEREKALHHLLAAKDAAVRARLAKETPKTP